MAAVAAPAVGGGAMAAPERCRQTIQPSPTINCSSSAAAIKARSSAAVMAGGLRVKRRPAGPSHKPILGADAAAFLTGIKGRAESDACSEFLNLPRPRRPSQGRRRPQRRRYHLTVNSLAPPRPSGANASLN
ncbi:hypothetical protein RA210_U220026 [Rubrivivax sp. A210]|nr:hypothetical protein RA210_U220026 [Rubrivivax sp. A210]